MQEMYRKQEESRQRELEERRRRDEEAKRKRLEEAERKREQMQEAMRRQRDAAKRSYVSNKRLDGVVCADLNAASLGRQDINKTKEQLAEEKKIAMKFRVKPLHLEGLNTEDLKRKINDLWDQIVQAESDRYDLEERQKRQEYDLKELNERERQINRNKALKKGIDPDSLSGKHPPKLQVASKYERNLDRRNFGEKKYLFDGGWHKLTKEEQEKQWEERINSFRESHGDKRVSKWDPSALRQQRYEDDRAGAIYDVDDDDDLEMMDAYKPFIQGEQQSARNEYRKSSVASSQANQSRRSSAVPAQPQSKKRVEEEEEVEEEEYEEEEEDEGEE